MPVVDGYLPTVLLVEPHQPSGELEPVALPRSSCPSNVDSRRRTSGIFEEPTH